MTPHGGTIYSAVLTITQADLLRLSATADAISIAHDDRFSDGYPLREMLRLFADAAWTLGEAMGAAKIQSIVLDVEALHFLASKCSDLEEQGEPRPALG